MNIEKKLNKLIIISSPSGAGKTTICKYLLKKIKDVDLSISYTTRQKRKNETNKKDYFFTNQDKFMQLKENNFFIETAKNFNNYYGSPYSNIENSFKKNHHILFDIDWKGARKLRSNYNKNQILDFFILPPSKRELKERLEKRGRDKKNEIDMRLSYAMSEMSHYKEYKYVIVNDKILDTVNTLMSIINYNILIAKLDHDIKKKLKFIK
jgi:guanylate kinase